MLNITQNRDKISIKTFPSLTLLVFVYEIIEKVPIFRKLNFVIHRGEKRLIAVMWKCVKGGMKAREEKGSHLTVCTQARYYYMFTHTYAPLPHTMHTMHTNTHTHTHGYS